MRLEKTKKLYSLPVPAESITSVVEDSLSHRGSYKGAIDFAVPLNTAVFAAAEGKITRVKDERRKHGSDKKFGKFANFVTIEHGEEYSEYLHLAQGSVEVKVGDQVERGQKIASTGLSGWMTAPHLHFIVYRHTGNKHGFEGLQIRFDSPLNNAK